MVAHIWDPSAEKTEAGGPGGQKQSGLHSETKN